MLRYTIGYTSHVLKHVLSRSILFSGTVGTRLGYTSYVPKLVPIPTPVLAPKVLSTPIHDLGTE